MRTLIMPLLFALWPALTLGQVAEHSDSDKSLCQYRCEAEASSSGDCSTAEQCELQCVHSCMDAWTGHAWRDPSQAQIYSLLFVGGGQIYAGESTKGLLMAAAGYGALAAGFAKYGSSLDSSEEINYDPLIAGLMVYAGAWAWSLMDAPASARRVNRRYGLHSAQLDFSLPAIARLTITL